MRTRKLSTYTLPYYLWILLFVIAPLILLLVQSFKNYSGNFTISNYFNFFDSWTYIRMTLNSLWIAAVVTVVTLLISYPMAYFLTRLKNRQFWLLLVILPTWVNLLLKTYAFIGLFAQDGSVNNFLAFIGLGRQQLLFTNTSFILVAAYIQIPFMIMPIFNALIDLNPSLVNAARDLGATPWQALRRVIFPLTWSGVRAGIQAVFIPTLSLFMVTRLIGGNKVINLGTAVEEHFLVTQNWGMGSTIGIVLIIAMGLTMYVTRDRKRRGDR